MVCLTYFLGPNENGCTMARLSLAYLSGRDASQRSGTKRSGSVKLREERLAMYWLIEIEIWNHHQ